MCLNLDLETDLLGVKLRLSRLCLDLKPEPFRDEVDLETDLFRCEVEVVKVVSGEGQVVGGGGQQTQQRVQPPRQKHGHV